jgi:hypothetical protein
MRQAWKILKEIIDEDLGSWKLPTKPKAAETRDILEFTADNYFFGE